MRFVRTVLFLVAACTCWGGATLAQEITGTGDSLQLGKTKIVGVVERFKVAYPDLKVGVGFAPGDPLSEGLPGELMTDLELSGYFQPVPRRHYLEDSQRSGIEGRQIDFPSWRLIGADYLVKGQVGREEGKVALELRFYDVAKSKQVEGRLYKLPEKDLPLAVHHFANVVLEKQLGTPGAFGTRIAFVANRGQRTDRKEIFVVDSDGRNMVPVTKNESLNLMPAWSPDGKLLSYVSYKKDGADLWVTETTTGRSTRISAGGVNTGPAWSPDGSKIAFAKNADLYVVRPDGTGLERLTRTRAIEVGPSWWPDGAMIYYGSDARGRQHIWRMMADGIGPEAVTHGSLDHENIAVSPDGRRIAYAVRTSAGYRIFVALPNGRGAIQVSQGPGNDEHPAWSGDSRVLAFSSSRDGGAPSIYLVSALGGIPESNGQRDGALRITDGRGRDTEPAWAPLPRPR